MTLLVAGKKQVPAGVVGISDCPVHSLDEGLQLRGCLRGHFQVHIVRIQTGEQIGVAVVEPGETLKCRLPSDRTIRVPDTLREQLQVLYSLLNAFNGKAQGMTLRIQDDSDVGMVCIDSAENISVAGSQRGKASGVGLVIWLAISLSHAWTQYLFTVGWHAAHGRLPWRLASFLSGARDLEILRQHGGSYQFRHARLQDRLASRPAGTNHRDTAGYIGP